jgi:DNA topoisomerase-1
LKKGQSVVLKDVRGEQHFTEPPPRYTEASLVKTLEEYGIGRPSTYASIISTLQQREYVELEKRRFRPTDVGRVVNRFLTQHFTDYVDYDFTARLEDELDAISRGEKQWVPLMRDFWSAFKQQVDTKAETVRRSDVTQEVLEEACPKCGEPLAVRLGRRGRFIGCTGFPDCDYTRNLDDREDAAQPELQVVEGRSCPKCGSALVIRNGRYGKFIGCSSYPDCRHMEPLERPADTGVPCPSCGKGNLLQRKSRRGKVFYSCSTYPACKYAVWNQPLNEPCPKCGWPMLTLRSSKRRGPEKVCPQAECGYVEAQRGVEESVASG